MRNYRLFAGIAAALIAGAGILSITAGSTPALPPPVTLRGSVPAFSPGATDGLGFVPPTFAELDPSGPPAADEEGTTDTVAARSAGSPDPAPSTLAPDTDSPDVSDAASIDSASEPDDGASADSPDD